MACYVQLATNANFRREVICIMGELHIMLEMKSLKRAQTNIIAQILLG